MNGSSATRLLDAARRYDRKGALEEAVGGYEAAIADAELRNDKQLLAEALRRLAVVRHRLQQGSEGHRLAERRCTVAAQAGDATLLAEGLNTLGGFHLMEESFAEAEARFRQALEHAHPGSQLRGRVEQNLGTVRGTQGDHAGAMAHYERSLAAFVAARDEHSCAIAHTNLGVMYKERRRWLDAESHFHLAHAVADRLGDTHLKGAVLLNRSEVLVALGRMTQARRAAEVAAGIFDELRATAELGDAYRTLGVILRETGQLKQAQARLRLAAEVSANAGSAIGEAEALRDLALTRVLGGDTGEVHGLLVIASRTLGRLKPCLEPEAVLEGNYPAAVRVWGELMRITEPAAAAHAERVGAGAAAVARELGRDAGDQARIRLAGYLSGVNPHLLDAAELPWGLGEIRSGAAERRMIGIVDCFHRATTPSPGGRGWAIQDTLEFLEVEREWWGDEVYSAFLRSRAA